MPEETITISKEQIQRIAEVIKGLNVPTSWKGNSHLLNPIDLWYKRLVALMVKADQIRLSNQHPAPPHRMMGGYPLCSIKPFNLEG